MVDSVASTGDCEGLSTTTGMYRRGSAMDGQQIIRGVYQLVLPRFGFETVRPRFETEPRPRSGLKTVWSERLVNRFGLSSGDGQESQTGLRPV